MNSDPQKILDRAEIHLERLAESGQEEIHSRLRSFLRQETHRLRMLHRYGLGGLDVASGQAQVVDAVISHAYRLALNRYLKKPDKKGNYHTAAIAAVGGYGRSELCPQSDVDLLILYDRASEDFGRFLASELIYLMWDIGLKVGHSFRTPEQCIDMAKQDSAAENSLLDSRLLVGGDVAFHKLHSLLARHCSKGTRTFVERKRAEFLERYGRLGETVFLLEPNVKESPGGLRDFHGILWMALGAWGLEKGEDLTKNGVLSPADWGRAHRGYDWIMRARNEMHFLTNRRADQLTFDLQPEVAAGLRISPRKHFRPVEVFMKQYFLHAQNVHEVLRLVMDAAQHTIGKRQRQVLMEWDNGLHFIRTNGELRLGNTGRNLFPTSPLDIMRACSVTQKMGLRLGEDVQNAVRNSLSMMNRRWQRDSQVSAQFMEMLRRPGKVGAALRSLHNCGFLGKYIPEFGHITRLMQHDYYHIYTTDEHTLRAVEIADRAWTNPPPRLERYQELTYHIKDPAVFYLGLLFHDIGKGLGGGHSEKGAVRAAAVCERLGMEPRQAAQVELLVRHHLMLSHLSQRRDLSDASVARNAAEIVGDIETLSMLCMLTFADASAVSPDVWTEWKNVLLWELFDQINAQFLGLEAATAREENQLLELRARAQALLETNKDPEFPETPLPPSAARIWMEDHLSLLPHRYLLGFRPELVAKQILLARRSHTVGPTVAFIPIPEEGYTLILLCCPDTPGLFARMAGALAALSVNILGARLDTRKDGMAADVLWISTPQGQTISDPSQMRRISATVEAVLNGMQSLEDLEKRTSVRPLAPVTKRLQLKLNNDISDTSTILEVIAADRLGLAYTISKTLTSLGLNIAFAKLSTEKTMAFDVFYLTSPDSGKIPEERWADILSLLEAALQTPAA